jgi:hypothetical protein
VNRTDYLAMLDGDVTIALDVCLNADEWADYDTVVLYRAAEVLANSYLKLKGDLVNEERNHCDPCLNGPAEGNCGRETVV